MNESQKIAEKNIQDTELVTTNKKSELIKDYIKRKALVSKGQTKTPQKFDINNDNNDEIINSL